MTTEQDRTVEWLQSIGYKPRYPRYMAGGNVMVVMEAKLLTRPIALTIATDGTHTAPGVANQQGRIRSTI